MCSALGVGAGANGVHANTHEISLDPTTSYKLGLISCTIAKVVFTLRRSFTCRSRHFCSRWYKVSEPVLIWHSLTPLKQLTPDSRNSVGHSIWLIGEWKCVPVFLFGYILWSLSIFSYCGFDKLGLAAPQLKGCRPVLLNLTSLLTKKRSADPFMPVGLLNSHAKGTLCKDRPHSSTFVHGNDRQKHWVESAFVQFQINKLTLKMLASLPLTKQT